jgi:hypothetical protein
MASTLLPAAVSLNFIAHALKATGKAFCLAGLL